jgi:hypothetical protein
MVGMVKTMTLLHLFGFLSYLLYELLGCRAPFSNLQK